MRYTLLLLTLCSMTCKAQTLKHYSTSEKETWKTAKVKLAAKPASDVLLEVSADAKGIPFQAWGTTFNELDLDAYRLLTREEQEQLMHNLYAHDGIICGNWSPFNKNLVSSFFLDGYDEISVTEVWEAYRNYKQH